MDSALAADAIHMRFCILAGHSKRSELLVGDFILPYLIAAYVTIKPSIEVYFVVRL